MPQSMGTVDMWLEGSGVMYFKWCRKKPLATKNYVFGKTVIQNEGKIRIFSDKNFLRKDYQQTLGEFITTRLALQGSLPLDLLFKEC